MKLTAMFFPKLKESKILGRVARALSSSSKPPPEDESGNGGWRGEERLLRKEVFIGVDAKTNLQTQRANTRFKR